MRSSARHREINNKKSAETIRIGGDEAAGFGFSMSSTSDMPFNAWHSVADFKASKYEGAMNT